MENKTGITDEQLEAEAEVEYPNRPDLMISELEAYINAFISGAKYIISNSVDTIKNKT